MKRKLEDLPHVLVGGLGGIVKGHEGIDNFIEILLGLLGTLKLLVFLDIEVGVDLPALEAVDELLPEERRLDLVIEDIHLLDFDLLFDFGEDLPGVVLEVLENRGLLLLGHFGCVLEGLPLHLLYSHDAFVFTHYYFRALL